MKESFIQIGAGAGDLDPRANYRDGFTETVKGIPRDKIDKIILVEPNPINIPLLKECWKEYPEAEIYEIGIVPKEFGDKNLILYYCPSDAPHYQVASIKKEHVKKHYGENCTLKEFTIKTRHLEEFISEAAGSASIGILALDIEGIDAEVVLEMKFGFNLRYLSFEDTHLGNDKERVIKHLCDSGFRYSGTGLDHRGLDSLYVNEKCDKKNLLIIR